MQGFFIGLYQFLHGVQDDPLWDDVYLTSGLFLFLITIVALIVYYQVLNRYLINWFKTSRWFLLMLINSIVVFIVTAIVSIIILELSFFDPAVLSFLVINFIYAAILYALFSLLFCLGSPHAKYTPYKFYSKSK